MVPSLSRLSLSLSHAFSRSFPRVCASPSQAHPRPSCSLLGRNLYTSHSLYRSPSVTMPTRAAAKRAAESLQAANALSSPPVIPDKDQLFENVDENEPTIQDVEISPVTPITTSKPKRKRVTKSKAKVEMKGDWDVLPHGLGKQGDLEDGLDGEIAVKDEAPPAKIARRGKNSVKDNAGAVKSEVKTETSPDAMDLDDQVVDVKTKLNGAKSKATKLKVKKEQETVDEDDKDGDFEAKTSQPKTQRKKRAPKTEDGEDDTKPKKAPCTKKHPYGLTPGSSPFPDFAAPSKEDCEKVYTLLSGLHGEVKAPDVIPPPSMEVTGCGEVPDLLDALLRTLLSASTTSRNSNMALQGLKDTFGLRTSGVGKGSINWEGVHQATLEDVIESIRKGGLAKAKGTNIKKILDVVRDRNLARFDALTKEKETGKVAEVIGAKHETQEQKDIELARFKENMLSMDYLFELTSDEVMNELTKLPGIGVKTSSCVILFCMKRPSFAVDTHVWRHCKWLGWVPEKANRDQTFSHCEVRIPNELKYALHQLFIKHGKACPRCRANTGPGTEEWDEAVCPIEHLVKRTGKMKEKQKQISPVKKAAKGKKGKKVDFEEEESEVELDDVMEESDMEDAVKEQESVKDEESE